MATPKTAFSLLDLTLDFPEGELSLICGRLGMSPSTSSLCGSRPTDRIFLAGSGKSLFLLALLGEADLLAGQLVCPRSKLDVMSTFSANASESDWVVKSVSAYVPQTAWLVRVCCRSSNPTSS